MKSSVGAKKIKVLFVCLGNICRSPSAQAVFEAQVKKLALEKYISADSCGTADYHIGKSPDLRSIKAAEKRGYSMTHLRGRQLSLKDFESFDYILAMDKENLVNILEIKPKVTLCHISLFLDFDLNGSLKEVPDPYYGGENGFETVLDLIESASTGLLKHIEHKHLKKI